MEYEGAPESDRSKDSEKEAANLIQMYIQYVVKTGLEPAGVQEFCAYFDLQQDAFLKHFATVEELHEAFWIDMLEDVLSQAELQSPDSATEVRQEIHKFYEYFFNRLSEHRSFILLTYANSWPGIGSKAHTLRKFRQAFGEWSGKVLEKAVGEGIIPTRAGLSAHYSRILWYQFLFLLNFWKQDKSHGHEKTLAVIDKSVALSFDLMEENAFDSGMDLVRFMFDAI